ncbi:cytochrome c biogenesis protein ResB [Micromonospora inyonensis]|uniref:Cytochrome c biogenesis protein n=1 Tax=Micromonospora inyonensis TaxID=47866 RepID=A0A1C6RHS0_9ACTN|nr:cytochrome c biogenesis protein ResB [Micromonospora inyonensis]SCL16677.1 cytochrome c biogenesis protein [Micromonospora inyonensis]
MALVDHRPATSTPPAPSRPNPVLALLRNSWRQLTSMRTALILLFLLAVAAVPGSVLPQRGVNPEDVDDFLVEHPDLGPALDRIGGFEVFGSVWFSAIYLLLFTSLVGCIVLRLRDHVRALRAAPPAAPKRLERLPQHAVLTGHDGDPEAIAAVLRRRRWRVVVRGNEVSAEKGYLKETGNLLFHTSMIAVLIGVALGSWYGWSGNRLLVAGADNAFCNTQFQYAESKFGSRVQSPDLPPFCLTLEDFQARFLESGQPEFYSATVTVAEEERQARREKFSVNSPLRLDGASVYLLGHGYAPIIRYTDRNGDSQTSTVPFLTMDNTLTGEGVALFPDVNADPATGKRDPNLQVAFEGLYLPTAPDAPPYVRSEHPTERNPAVFLVAYRGNLGVDAGIPGSVYQLDQRQVRTGKLKQLGDAKLLKPGEKWTLDDGTSVEFLGTEPFVTLSVRHDPGSTLMLVSSGVLLIGLMGSLFGRRRRVWFRVVPAGAGGSGDAVLPAGTGGPAGVTTDDADAPAGRSTTDGSSLVQAGGLPRTEYPGFADEFSQLVDAVRGSGGTGAAEQAAPGSREGTE